jgi:hypothetical protein
LLPLNLEESIRSVTVQVGNAKTKNTEIRFSGGGFMKITHFLGAVALIFSAFSFSAVSVQAANDFVTVKHAKAKWAGRPACASKYPAGKGQGAAFRHLLTKSCYSCPTSYKRTVFPLKAKNACERIVKAKTYWKKAAYRGKLFKSKPKDAFIDPRNGGEYWSCPAGTHRTVLHAVTSSKACERRASTSYARAPKYRKNSRIAQGCPSGKFWDAKGGDGLLGACYSCPSGYRRSASAVNSSKACYRTIGAKLYRAKKHGALKNPKPAGAFLDPRNKGEYWSCPKGYGRTVVYAVTSSKACKNVIPAKSYVAKVKSRGTFGCRAGAFQNGLENACYTCPATYKRSAAIGKNLHRNKKACVYVKVDPGALENQKFVKWALAETKKIQRKINPLIREATKTIKSRKTANYVKAFGRTKSRREKLRISSLIVADLRKFMAPGGVSLPTRPRIPKPRPRNPRPKLPKNPFKKGGLDIRHASADYFERLGIVSGPRLQVASATGLTRSLMAEPGRFNELRRFAVYTAPTAKPRKGDFYTVSLGWPAIDFSLIVGVAATPLMAAWDVTPGSKMVGVKETQGYTGTSWSVGLTAGADTGIIPEIGFWTEPNWNLGGDSHGFIIAASVKVGAGLSFWWNYDNHKTDPGKFLGVTITPQLGVSAEAEYVRGNTASDHNNYKPPK